MATCPSTPTSRPRPRVASGADLDLSAVDAAAGIHEIVNQNMAAAARMHAVEQGIDLRGVSLLAFGGAGPVHACGVAELLESPQVIFPVNASVLSAFGTLVSPVRIDLARSMPRRLDAIDPAEREGLLDELRTEGRRVLAAAGVPADKVVFRYGIDARYAGQGNEITIWVGEGDTWPADDASVRSVFEDEYRRIYGLTIPDVAIEAVTWRLSAFADVDTVEPDPVPAGSGAEPIGHRPMVFGRAMDAHRCPGVQTRPARRRRHLRRPCRRRRARDHRRHPARLDRRGRRRRQPGGHEEHTMSATETSTTETTTGFDPIELEILWQSLISTVNEQAKALQRSAFSPIVREAGDLANAVFDRRGRMVAQAVTGTPGHINSLAMAAVNILEEYPPDSLVPGDIIVTNDPYKTAGQLLDVTVLVPVWRNGQVIAFFGSTIHHTDVGGYGIGAGGRDVFEEGLWIPICKLMRGGADGASLRNDDVWKFILSNVRQPDHMAGDLHAQMASGEIGAQRLQRAVRQPRPRRHRGARRRDHQPLRGRHPRQHP